MRPFSIVHLRLLASRYCEATGATLASLSSRVFTESNHKLFSRLMNGAGCSAENAEHASVWFVENWPADVAWPEGVPAADTESPRAPITARAK